MCAAAAYRAGEKIYDDRYGETHDYTRRTGIEDSFILTPDNTPDWMKDRAELWNGVEAAEKRRDSQLSREVLLSLPHELNRQQRLNLVREFVEDNFISKGMIADVSIHQASNAGDERNLHAHILLTMRELTGEGFGKKERDWNDKAYLSGIREEWANHQNRTFERLGIEVTVDHRSLEDQGIDREPEPKLGDHATEAMRDGEPERADRVIQNYEEVKARNEQREHLKQQAEIINLALERAKKAQSDRHAEQIMSLAERQAKQFKNLQDGTVFEVKRFKAQGHRSLRKSVHDAKARTLAYRKELQPSFTQRIGEFLRMKGKEAQHHRNLKLRHFKHTEQKKLNTLRAELRKGLRTRKQTYKSKSRSLIQSQGKEREGQATDILKIHRKQIEFAKQLEKGREATKLKKQPERTPDPKLKTKPQQKDRPQTKEQQQLRKEKPSQDKKLSKNAKLEKAIRRQKARKKREREARERGDSGRERKR